MTDTKSEIPKTGVQNTLKKIERAIDKPDVASRQIFQTEKEKLDKQIIGNSEERVNQALNQYGEAQKEVQIVQETINKELEEKGLKPKSSEQK